MKTVVITGGNTGIGFETAAALADQGYRTIIACRDAEKGKAAVQKLNSRVPKGKIESRLLDLADFASIEKFAKDLLSKRTAIDVLINNAGVMACPHMRTKDGLELQIGTNHFGHFLLTSLLYPLLKKGKGEARIINVSSMAHRHFGGINFDDINGEKRYSPWFAYGRSKLANLLFTYELARRIPKTDNVTVNACHPGIVATELQRHALPQNPNLFQKPLIHLMNNLIKTPTQGAATSIYLATSPEVSGMSGKYFKDCKETSSNGRSHNERDAKRLWEISNTTTKSKWAF